MLYSFFDVIILMGCENMKKYKALSIYYIMSLVLSLTSLVMFNNKSSDFCIALSSITSELSLIISAILIIYALLFCSSYIKDNKVNRKSIFTSLIILSITTLVVFISFINVFSHRNFIDYFIRIINKKESYDIVRLIMKFLAIYLYIFLFAIIILLLSNYYNKNKKDEVCLLSFLLIVLLIVLLNIRYEQIKFIFTIDITLYLMLLTMSKDKLI